MLYRFLADAILILHTVVAAFLVIGQLLIVLGGLRSWQWIRRYWFRLLHLATIALVTMESWLGVQCPLTTLENQLRASAGQKGYEQGFIADWFGRILFYQAAEWVFILVYSMFGLVVLASWFIWPPQRKPK
jgi:hypothetical protein